MTGITLSSEQKSLAEKRIKDAKLQHLVSVLLCDYRKTPVPESGYDRIISIGMFEHVGRKYLNEYFRTISRLLNPTTGVLVIDGITFTNKVCASVLWVFSVLVCRANHGITHANQEQRCMRQDLQ